MEESKDKFWFAYGYVENDGFEKMDIDSNYNILKIFIY